VRLGLALVALAGLILAASAGAVSERTTVSVYRPFSGAGVAPGLQIVRTAKGDCFAGSLADPRRDAWRCEIGNAISDPCFSSAAVVSWVLCPADGTPFGKKLVRLALSKALPKTLGNDGSAGQGNPWTVKLVNGKVCTFLTGATFSFRGQRVNYGCDRKTFLAGSPDRSRPTWTITLGTSPKSVPRPASIAVAAW
jgi:hypothetical protein